MPNAGVAAAAFAKLPKPDDGEPNTDAPVAAGCSTGDAPNADDPPKTDAPPALAPPNRLPATNSN